jgi:hypothetical protein
MLLTASSSTRGIPDADRGRKAACRTRGPYRPGEVRSQRLRYRPRDRRRGHPGPTRDPGQGQQGGRRGLWRCGQECRPEHVQQRRHVGKLQGTREIARNEYPVVE